MRVKFLTRFSTFQENGEEKKEFRRDSQILVFSSYPLGCSYRRKCQNFRLGAVAAVVLVMLPISMELSISPVHVNSPDNTILKDLKAECTQEGINVNLLFSKPFSGIAYSHGHYDSAKCRYITDESPTTRHGKGANDGTNFSFLIPMNGCGTVYHGGQKKLHGIQRDKRAESHNGSNEVYIENTLLIQNDPQIQEENDIAKTLRCVWQKEIHQPLMASLPIGNANWFNKIGKEPHAKLPSLSPKNGSDALAQWSLRFLKKGNVQSVPMAERRHHSRALKDTLPIEEGSVPTALHQTGRGTKLSPPQRHAYYAGVLLILTRMICFYSFY